jgi:Lrp/AsnC family transcriptional regulator for asnA, asnC and gidA
LSRVNEHPRPLDEVDKSLIEELQIDGRLAFATLAPRVGLSEAATRQRVNKLLERGVVQVVAVTDPAMVGLRHQAMVGINVDTDVREVANQLAKIEAVDYVVIAAGRYDLLVELFCADQEEFVNIVNDQIRPVDGIRVLEILTYLSLVKQTYNWGSA